MTLMEVEFGILLSERRDAAQGSRLRFWMTHHVLPEFLDRTLPVDAAVALRCASLHVPDPRAERDALIAATALVHGMTVVTECCGLRSYRSTALEPLGSSMSVVFDSVGFLASYFQSG